MSKLAKIMAMASMFSGMTEVRTYSSGNIAVGISGKTEDEKMKRKGLTKFYMGRGIYIWALNEKSAIKKYDKRKK